jgi:hypothetical protein
LPIVLKITEGQGHDGRSTAGLGKGQTLLADRAYGSNALREMMTAKGAFANIKPTSRRKKTPVFQRL